MLRPSVAYGTLVTTSLLLILDARLRVAAAQPDARLGTGAGHAHAAQQGAFAGHVGTEPFRDSSSMGTQTAGSTGGRRLLGGVKSQESSMQAASATSPATDGPAASAPPVRLSPPPKVAPPRPPPVPRPPPRARPPPQPRATPSPRPPPRPRPPPTARPPPLPRPSPRSKPPPLTRPPPSPRPPPHTRPPPLPRPPPLLRPPPNPRPPPTPRPSPTARQPPSPAKLAPGQQPPPEGLPSPSPVRAPLPSSPAPPLPSPPTTRRPNFLIIMTDDQDDLLNSTHPRYMPALDRHLGRQGVRVTDFVASTPLCCPARATFFTGQYAHCTNITSNNNPGGSYAKFMSLGLDESYLPVWLQDAGYDNYLVGKFLNHYNEPRRARPGDKMFPNGWKHFEAITHKSTCRFYDTCMSLNGQPNRCYTGQYQTDLLRDKALDIIRSAGSSRKPFMLFVAPVAPHTSAKGALPPQARTNTAYPADRHGSLYAGDSSVSLPLGDSFNVANANLGDVRPLRPNRMADLQLEYVQRLRALKAVDEMLDALVLELEEQGLLDNTYVLFTSDNGYHLGAFNAGRGKGLPIEEDIHVPLYVRGPGIPAGRVLPYQGGMIDIAPTIMALAGLPIPATVNGLPMPLAASLVAPMVRELRASLAPAVQLPANPEAWWSRDAILLEGWANGDATDPDDDEGQERYRSYKALRLCTDYKVFPDSGVDGSRIAPRILGQPDATACYKYVAWCSDNAREFFDLSTDPYETRNRLSAVPQRVLDRFDGIMSALIHCQRTECRNPYALLHPGQPVFNLTSALRPEYDTLYRDLFKFMYDKCASVYVPEFELTWTQRPRQR